VGGGEQGVFCAALKRVVLSVVVERAEHFASASEYKCGVSPHLLQMPRRGRAALAPV